MTSAIMNSVNIIKNVNIFNDNTGMNNDACE